MTPSSGGQGETVLKQLGFNYLLSAYYVLGARE